MQKYILSFQADAVPSTVSSIMADAKDFIVQKAAIKLGQPGARSSSLPANSNPVFDIMTNICEAASKLELKKVF